MEVFDTSPHGRRCTKIMMDDVVVLAEQATNLLHIKRFDAARTITARALGSEPSDGALHVLMARIEHESGNEEAALRAVNTAMGLEPTASALHVASIIHRSLRNFDESKRLLEGAIEIRPEAPELHVGLSLTLAGPFFGDDAVTYLGSRDAGALDAATASARTAMALDAELASPPLCRGSELARSWRQASSSSSTRTSARARSAVDASAPPAR